MMKTFTQECEKDIADQKTSTASLSVSRVRTFHQHIMVGLIEASRGVREMFRERYEGDAAPPPVLMESSNEGSPPMTLAQAYDDLQAMLGIVIPEYISCITMPLKNFFAVYERRCEVRETSETHVVSCLLLYYGFL
jgi:hypothetical protein